MQKFDFPDGLTWQEPQFLEDVFVASGAQVVGNVHLGRSASVWYNAVLRGDINRVSIGAFTNIQDGVVCHVENDRACVVGDYVTVGHKAILHGCVIEACVLVGMGAIILNGAVLRRGVVVGAGAVVTENMDVPENALVLGVPGRVVRDLGRDSAEKNKKWAEKYVQLAAFHRQRKP